MIKLSKMVQPHFYPFWHSKAPYLILNGGRGSFKSSTVSLKLLMMLKKQAQQGHKANVIIIRENTVNLRDSVYSQIGWAINKLKMADEFVFNVSPMRITHRGTGSTFYFYGGDKPEKLKSNTVRNVIAVWYEEAANFKSAEVFDQTNPTFIRQKSPWVDQVQVFYTYNPPKNPYDWINEWVDSVRGDPDFFIDTSTYLNDELGFTDGQQLKLIEKYKTNDYDYYRWLYLGEIVGLGTNVYNMDLFHLIKHVPEDDPLIYLFPAMDSGHISSATALPVAAVTSKGNVIVLDTYYYSPANQSLKKPPSLLSKEIHDFLTSVTEKYRGAKVKNMTIDSAEGAMRNQYYSDYHVVWHPVHKLKEADMIDYVQSLLAQGRVFVLDTPNNKVFMEQHRQYQWDEKSMESDDPKVIKENDHTVDAFKYMVLDNARILGLKR
jgi:phage terminase large subunit